MPMVSTEVIDSTQPFDSVPTDKLSVVKASNSLTASTESMSSDNMPSSAVLQPATGSSQQRGGGSTSRVHRAGTSHPQRGVSPSGTPGADVVSHELLDSPSSLDNKGMVHTRTNFGKTRGYVPPVVPSSPGRDPDNFQPSATSTHRRRSTNPFDDDDDDTDDDDDAPHDEVHSRTAVRSVRPKPGQQHHSDGSGAGGARRSSGRALHHRGSKQHRPRPEAYISETDDSSLGHQKQHHDFPSDKNNRTASPSLNYQEGQETRHPSPDDEPFDTIQARHPSPIENIQLSPIRPRGNKVATAADAAATAPVPDGSPTRRSSAELGELRRRRRRKKQQFEMAPAPPEVQGPVKSFTSTKTSDLTDESAEPVPSFDQGAEETKDAMVLEMEYHSDDLRPAPPPPSESPRYETFGRETMDTSVSPQKEKPKSILRSKRASSKGSPDIADDDDSLFDFDGNGEAMASSVRRSSLKNGTTSNTRKGRRPRRRSNEESGNDDDESLIQYGERRESVSSLQERTQQAWTFRSQRSFPKSQGDAPSPRKDEVPRSLKKEASGVQFGNTDTIHHFNDNETILTTGTNHSLNSLYTKSPESEAEDLIKDLFLIGSGEHSNPGRRKFKYQPEFKRQLKGDDRSIDDNTLGTTDVSLNTLDNTAGGTAYSEATPNTGVTDGLSLETYPQTRDVITACESMDRKENGDDMDPLAFVWDYVESGMQALGLASTPPRPSNETKEEPADDEKKPVPVVPVPTKTKEAELEEEWNRKGMEEAAAESSAQLGGIARIDTTGSAEEYPADEYPADEMKENGKESFGGVMDYLFGGPTKPAKEHSDKKTAPSCAGSVTTTGTPLEEDPRLEQLALHAVRSKHELFDMVYDESVPVNIEKDIKFSVVKTKLPLGILFHENAGGCWITKVFPDGHAAKSGGVEVGDQLAAINGDSAIKLRVDQICTLITEAPNPNDIQLTFVRYTGKLHPVSERAVVSERSKSQEGIEVQDMEPPEDPPAKKNLSRSLKPLAKLRSPSPNANKSMKPRSEAQKPPKGGDTKTRKGIGKWFGKGKKKSQEGA